MLGFIKEFVFLSAIFLFANFSFAEEEQFYANTFLPSEYRQIEYLQGDGEALRPTHQKFLLPADADEDEFLMRWKCFSNQQPAVSGQSAWSWRCFCFL
jgi:hypothetical protein